VAIENAGVPPKRLVERRSLADDALGRFIHRLEVPRRQIRGAAG
jgi:hypothetical protein